MPPTVPATEIHRTSQLPLKARRALVQRILWSREVAKSGRIRDFLSYICVRALEDQDAQVHEQEIGHNVFGRPADYNPYDDNIVRVTASNARKKLKHYFATEGISEPVILEIPKGKYMPLFRERDSAESADAALSLLQVQIKLRIYRRALVLLGACALLLVVCTVWSIATLRRASLPRSGENSALDKLWSQLLLPSGHMDVIVPDSSLSAFEKIHNHQIGLVEYLNNQWMVNVKLAPDPPLENFAEWTARQALTSVPSVRTVYQIAQLSLADRSRVSILRPRDFNMTQMKSDNVVLLGSSRANPWQDLIDSQVQFQFKYDQKQSCPYFESSNPGPGKPAIYGCDPNFTYSRIAFVPNLSGKGNVLSVAGTDSEGTGGGGEFVTSESSVEKVWALAGKGRGTRMPYFEALLKGRKVDGDTGQLSIIAFRLVQPTALSNSQRTTQQPK